MLEAISAGALGVIALLLLVVIGRLGRIEKALDSPKQAVTEPESTAIEATPTDVSVEPEAATAATAATAAVVEAPDEDGPYERDGRWWFRRGDEELVFDEATETWKPAG